MTLTYNSSAGQFVWSGLSKGDSRPRWTGPWRKGSDGVWRRLLDDNGHLTVATVCLSGRPGRRCWDCGHRPPDLHTLNGICGCGCHPALAS